MKQMEGEMGMDYKPPTTYTASAVCTNCGRRGKITLPRGKQRPEKAICPTCGCNTYVRPLDD